MRTAYAGSARSTASSVPAPVSAAAASAAHICQAPRPSSAVMSAGAAARATDQDSWYVARYRPRRRSGAASVDMTCAGDECTSSAVVYTSPAASTPAATAVPGGSRRSAANAANEAAKTAAPSAAARVRLARRSTSRATGTVSAAISTVLSEKTPPARPSGSPRSRVRYTGTPIDIAA